MGSSVIATNTSCRTPGVIIDMNKDIGSVVGGVGGCSIVELRFRRRRSCGRKERHKRNKNRKNLRQNQLITNIPQLLILNMLIDGCILVFDL